MTCHPQGELAQYWDGAYKGEEREIWCLNLAGTETLGSMEYHAFDCRVSLKGWLTVMKK